MASSENLMTMEPWLFRETFADSWISEAFARDTETLNKALQESLPDNYTADLMAEDVFSSLFNLVRPETSSSAQTPSASGSNRETTAPKRRALPVSRKIIKRKSRASKRTTTTFIAADPANFRQLVQQATGVRLVDGHVPVLPLLKPEPERPGASPLQGCLPTLDTSAFLLDLDHQQPTPSSPSTSSIQPRTTTVPPQPPSTNVGGGCAASDFDSFAFFPTLESWKVM